MTIWRNNVLGRETAQEKALRQKEYDCGTVSKGRVVEMKLKKKWSGGGSRVRDHRWPRRTC